MPGPRCAKFLLGSFLGGSLLSGGCATGQTAFNVVSGQNTPTPVVTAEPTVTVPLSPAQPATVSEPTTAASNVTEYTVGPGESLWRITRRLLGDGKLYIHVAQANHISDPALIQP
ncbi:MAG: LysM peptidoglycan-binding domain-containing protein, partial [Candidatus Firestonebacteria bacterium]|nr:LysM peptidoglycan-binding domain-containing protein [Candidatus Firestonebacteria bacterium]